MAAKKEFPLAFVIRTVDKATAGIRKVNSEIARVGAKIEKAGKAMSTHLTLPIVGMGAASVAAFAQFEKGMSSVSTLIDTSTENIDAMSKEVLAMGTRVGVPINDLTSALYDVRSAGIDAGMAMGVLENSAKLGVAGLGTTKEAADLATSSINAFGLEGAEADRVYDTIFKTVKAGKTNISELSQGFGGVAATVGASGVSLEEFMAATAALTTGGGKASEAYTGLKNIVNGLTRETEKSRKVFRSLGAKDFQDLIKKSGGLVPALERIKTAVKGNKSALLDLQIGSEGLNAVMALTGTRAQTFADSWADMREGPEAMSGAFDKQNATMMARWQRTKNALMSAGVSIGEVLAPALEKVAGHLQAAAAWFNGLDASSKKAVITFAAITAAIGPALTIIGKYGKAAKTVGEALAWAKKSQTIVKGLGAVGKAFMLLGSVLKAVGVAMLANPVILVITAIAVAALLIWKYWEPIKKFFVNLWDGMPEPIKRFLGWVKTIFLNFTPLGRIIKHWEPIRDFFTMLWQGIRAVFEAEWARIKAIVDAITGAVDKVIEAGQNIDRALFGDEDFDPVAMARQRLWQGPNVASGPSVFGAMSPSRLLGAGAPGQPGQNGETRVMVEFANAPKGTRVDQESRGAAVDLSVGYQMGGL